MISVAILAIAALLALFVMGRVSESGQAPGLVDGHLAHCPERPNCVCSEYPNDADHYIEPLGLAGKSAADVIASIRAVLIESGGMIQSERADYIAATFASPLFGFVDDLEIRLDMDEDTLHFRSASRVGRGDLGANRKRVESIRSLIRSGATDD